MKGIAVWACVAAAASMLLSLAAGAVTISGSITTVSGGFAQINFTCDGSPTCTGTYTATLHDNSCSAPASSSGGITITGMNPAQAGFSGNMTLTGFNYFLSNCTTTTTTLSGTYTATSDGTTGSMSAQMATPDGSATLQGGFSVGAPSTVRISGILSASDAEGSLRISFSCAGTPTCIGTYNAVQQDHGCSNAYSYSDSFVINSLDLSHPGSFSGTAIHYSDSNSTGNSGGACTYGITDNHAHSSPYTATWDGTTGTMNLTAVNGDGTKTRQITGTFTAAGLAPSPTFPMTVISNITPTTANASAQIQPRPQDAGTTQSIFVFAYAPQSVVSASGKRLPWTGEVAARALDGPDPCVLAQVNASGQLTGATASTMQAYTTGVLTSQGQSVSILNNVSTPNVAGATMYVGYGASSANMFSNGTYQGAVNIPGAAQCTTNLATAAAPATPGALTGLWWNANESGWGIHFTQRGSNVFAAWYTYDAAGKPKWYVSTCSGFTGASGICNGTLYEVTGPNFFGGAFNPSLVNATSAGSLQLNFANPNAASMTYTASGQTRTVSLTRQPLASGTTAPAVDFSDIWWAGASESGWGMAMAQQYGITFLAWYVYDANGKPTWLVATCTMSGTSCSGTLYRTTGPNFGPTFNPAAVQATQAGTISVNFTDANNAIINYTVDGVTATKAVTRQLF